ncbi:uncharacterized protein LOC144112034 [Amblyomma americanum]
MHQCLRSAQRRLFGDSEAGCSVRPATAFPWTAGGRWSSARTVTHWLLFAGLLGTAATLMLVVSGVRTGRETMAALAASQPRQPAAGHGGATSGHSCAAYRTCLWFRHATIQVPLFNLLLPASRWFSGGDGFLSAAASGVAQEPCGRFGGDSCS